MRGGVATWALMCVLTVREKTARERSWDLRIDTAEIIEAVQYRYLSNTLVCVCLPASFCASFYMRVCMRVYLVCPSESFQTGSMATGLMAHSRMARARANSLALLHICTAFIQLIL